MHVSEDLEIGRAWPEAVASLALRALKGADLPALLDEAVVSVARALAASYCEIFELLPDCDGLLLRAGVGWKAGQVGHATVGVETDSHAGYALLSAEPVIVEDLATETRFSGPELLREHGIVSSMCVSIPGRERPYGVLGVHSKQRRTFSRNDIHFAQAIANVLAITVEREIAERERASLLARVRVARAEAESLGTLRRLINESLDLREVGQRIADSVLELLAVDAATVLSLEAESGDLRVLAVAGHALRATYGELAFPHGTGLSGFAVKMRHPVVSKDVLSDPRLVYSRQMRERLSQSEIRSGLAVPLIAEGTVIGVLALGAREREFANEQIRLAEAFGDKAAAAIRNAQLHDELHARLTQSETLLAVSEQITAVMDITEIMRRVARHVGRALGADMVGAFLADPVEERLRPIAGWHVPKHLLGGFLSYAIPLRGHRILEEAWQRRAPVWLKNVGADPRVDRESFERFPHRSNLFCPMLVHGKPVGGLFVTWWQVEHEFKTDELQLVEGISRQAGIALANARLVEELKAHQARLEILLQLGRGLSRIQPQAALLSGIARACGELLGNNSVGVRLAEGNELVLAASWGDPEQIRKPRVAIGESLTGCVAMTGEALVVAEPESDSRLTPEYRARIQGLGYRAWLGVPIKIGNRVAGVLSILTHRSEGFSAEDAALAAAFASQAAVALENARLYQEVDEASRTLNVLSRRLVESQEAERRHIARELHDEIGQLLTGLKLALETGVRAASPEIAKANADEAQQLVHHLIERVRGLSLDLRPAMLDDLGLVATLLWHFDRYTAQTRIRVEFERGVPPMARFPSSIETTTYRIVQEALTNVARHAAVTEVTVRLWTSGDRLYVQIQDAGIGFDPQAARAGETSTGLAGMRERAALLGGILSVDSAPGAGARLTAEFRVRDDSQADT